MHKKDPRIRVIHQENRGLPAARNTGLRAASGEWIICVDSDDLWKSDLLESVMEVASDAVDLIAFGYMPYPEGQPLPQPSPLRTGTYRTGKRELLNALQLGVLDEYHRAVPYYSGACWIELVRRDFLEENHLYFDESLKQCEDMIWNLNLLERAHSVGLLDKDLYYYRLRPDSMCHIHDKRLPGYLDTVDQRVVEFGQREKKGADFWAAYDIWLMKTYVRLLDKCYFNPANPDRPDPGLARLAEDDRRLPDAPAPFESAPQGILEQPEALCPTVLFPVPGAAVSDDTAHIREIATARSGVCGQSPPPRGMSSHVGA